MTDNHANHTDTTPRPAGATAPSPLRLGLVATARTWGSAPPPASSA